ncbi:MAG: pyruvoyl-dependent arginine decarboxylase [Candidatus Bathyarchaeota archaeon]|nr:MAG: pyruvoyl-dependent arginine decarboxylase [Candidatus Bathyarchaeota archaeon]
MRTIPREFFVTSGEAFSSISQLNAFDHALKNARIEQCNLVPVSSILPPTCQERGWKKVSAGSITHTVMARMDGVGEATIAAGIAWAWEERMRYGLVAEASGHMEREALRTILRGRIDEMADARGVQIQDASFRIEVLKVPLKTFGCVLAALIFLP